MRRPVTDAERQTLMANPELVMFAPQHQGIHPTVFLLVIPVITMVILGALLWFTDMGRTLIDSAPMASCFVFIAVCVLVPWICLRIKWWYDDAYGCDRELRGYLRHENLTVEVVRIAGVVPERAEVYAEGDEGPFMFGIAGTRNTFVPEVCTKVALLSTGEIGLAVRPDPRTQSFLS